MATWILLLSITSLATSAPNSASIEDIMETFTGQTARIAELTKEINDLKSLNSEQKNRITSLEKQTEELQAEKEIRTDTSKKLVYFAKEVMKATEVVMSKFGGLSDEFEVSDLFGELRSILPSGSSVSTDLTVVHREEVGNPPDYFQKTFAEYEQGFQSNGESWMGLVGLHEMTDSTDFGLRIEMGDYGGQKYHAVYDSFKVGPGPDYALTVEGFRPDLSTLGDSMASNNGAKFSTKDTDQDTWGSGSCSTVYGGSGGWWYNHCSNTNPTAHHSTSRVHGRRYLIYRHGGARGTSWDSWATATFTLVPRG